jgi:hypothetical protein
MQKLLPGFYVDAAGALHIDEREVCEHAGVPYTERNAQVIADVTVQTFNEIARTKRLKPPQVQRTVHDE